MVSHFYSRCCGSCGKRQKFLQWQIGRVSALTSSPSVHVEVDSRAVTFFDYFPQTSENRLCLDTCSSIYNLVNIYCPWLHNPRYSVLLWERLWIRFSCLHKRIFFITLFFLKNTSHIVWYHRCPLSFHELVYQFSLNLIWFVFHWRQFYYCNSELPTTRLWTWELVR